MKIDESKAKALTRFKKGVPISSDHNYLSCTFNIPLQKQRNQRQEVYRLRNKTDLQRFKDETTHTKKFSKCFTENGDVQKEGKKWFKTLQNTISNCFKKVRITKRKKDPIQEQLDLRRKIKSDINSAKTAGERHHLEDELLRIEEEISANSDTKYFEKIKEQLQIIVNKDGSTNNTGVWKLRQKIFPKPVEKLSAKKDQRGNLITNPEVLKDLYIDGYLQRLIHREMFPCLLKLKTLSYFNSGFKYPKQTSHPIGLWKT